MSSDETILSKQEKKYILEQRVTRLSDNKEVQIYPMGAERYLASILSGKKNCRSQYKMGMDILGKDVLVIPGHGNSGFLFAQAGVRSVTIYDKDPVTIAWMKAFKKFYNYREYRKNGKPYPSIGELLAALTHWYPPLIALPAGKYFNSLSWVLNPNLLRRAYIHYMVSLVQRAIQSKTHDNFELDKNIQFHAGTIDTLRTNNEKPIFDVAFVPYLLGIENGIEKKDEIVVFIKQVLAFIPQGRLLVTPSQNTKDFYVIGKRYFVTTGYIAIQNIPELADYFIAEDKEWFRRQGLAIFMSH